MAPTRTFRKNQIEAANTVLERLRVALGPEFLGLVSTEGHLISVISDSGNARGDAFASLAASSFAATRQLARIMNDSEFTVMFHEGSKLNVHIAQVSDDVLLVICFHRATQIGKVRLMSGRIIRALGRSLSAGGADVHDGGSAPGNEGG